MDIGIDLITMGDWKEFKKLRLRALQNEPSAFLSSYVELKNDSDDKWKTHVKEFINGNSIVIVAKNKDTFIGMVGAYFSKYIKARHVASIWGTYVDKEYRGQKIGYRMLQKLIETIQTFPHIKKILVEASSSQKEAQSLYQKLGFNIIGTYKNQLCVNNKYYDEMLMEKFL